MFSKHVTKDISAYCHGELAAEESRRFAEHIISCAKCRREFEEIKLGIKLAEQLPQLKAPDHLWLEIKSRLGAEQRPLGLPVASAIALRQWRRWCLWSRCSEFGGFKDRDQKPSWYGIVVGADVWRRAADRK